MKERRFGITVDTWKNKYILYEIMRWGIFSYREVLWIFDKPYLATYAMGRLCGDEERFSDLPPDLDLVDFLILNDGDYELNDESRESLRHDLGRYFFVTDYKHFGDCTREANSCLLCSLQTDLDDYESYCEEKRMIRRWKTELPQEFIDKYL